MMFISLSYGKIGGDVSGIRKNILKVILLNFRFKNWSKEGWLAERLINE